MEKIDTNLQKQLDDLKKKIDERSLLKEVRLPEWPESKRATPNSFLRSTLFSAVQSKDRIWLREAFLASQDGFAIKYTGQQLNQEDLTLWESLVHLAKYHPLGDICKFTAYDILTSMKLGTSSSEYERLHSGIIRLTACAVEIIHSGYRYAGSLIEEGVSDDVTGHYIIRLNPQLMRLYKDNTWIDLKQRIQIRKKPLAQFLHGYYSSHRNPFPVKLETLQQLSGSKNKRISSFKQKIDAALDALMKIGFLESYSIDDDLITVKRK